MDGALRLSRSRAGRGELSRRGAGRPRPRAQGDPVRFFYDERGSALFEEICELPEYYPTRTEIAILEEYAGEIAAQIGRACRLVEFGSGASRKVRMLLQALEPAGRLCAGRHLARASARRRRLARRRFPGTAGRSRSAPITRGPFDLPPLPGPRGKRVGFFPGLDHRQFRARRGRAISGELRAHSWAPAARCWSASI